MRIMKTKSLFILAFSAMLLAGRAHAQLENIIVELYYVSDSLDATDTIGGGLAAGSKTYRIYADLTPDAKLRRMYGDANHPIRFESTANFFNNKSDGESFGFDFAKTRLDENTVALDTWLTLGQTTRSSSKQGGILKIYDTDGSFIAGPGVNDGGSAEIAEGLLNNNDTLAGIPLTSADGNDTLPIIPTDANSLGIINVLDQSDSTIFGSIIPGNKFESRNAAVFNSGTKGVDTLQNHVLLAQLTTLGDISFEINLEVEVQTQTGPQIIKYVARDSVLLEDEVLSPLLTYPQACGCQDPDYLEYSPSFACSDSTACLNLIVFGCMDPLACNYNASANFNIQEICCYIGNCNDLDIAEVCPELSANNLKQQSVLLFPNPGNDLLSIQATFDTGVPVDVSITSSLGALVYAKSNILPSAGNTILLDALNITPGVYFVQIQQGDNLFNAYWIKQ
jgi:hypothetical protein